MYNIIHMIVLLVLFRGIYCDQTEDEKRPYEFGFSIEGEQHRYEKKDINGIIQGEFGFITADGVYHVTVYATDEKGNFRILKMKNIRIREPLDKGGRSLSNASQKNLQDSKTTGIPTSHTTTTTEHSIHLSSFRTLSTIAMGCSGCGIITKTPPPMPHEPIEVPKPEDAPKMLNTILPKVFEPQKPVITNTYRKNDIFPGLRLENRIEIPPGGDPRSLSHQPSKIPEADLQIKAMNARLPKILQLNKADISTAHERNYGSLGVRLENPNLVQSNGNPLPVPHQQSKVPVTEHQGNVPGTRLSNVLQQRKPEVATAYRKNDFSPGLTLENPKQVQSEGYPALPKPAYEPPFIKKNIALLGKERQPISQNTLPSIEITDKFIHVPGNDIIPIQDRFANMKDGLPQGITKNDISDLLYKFNYTVGFHGHYEKGFSNGAKIGGYFFNGRDGYSRVITYVADENGYRPRYKLVYLGLDSPDIPKPESEKKFGLQSFEFVWYPVK